MDNQIKGYIINESPSVMTQPEIVSESKCNRVVIKTTLQDADARNRNKRIYPKSVLDKGLHSEYVQERIRTKTFYGEAGHPLKPDIQRQLYMDQSNISHIVTSFWWEGNQLKGYVEAANTERGKDFDGLVRQGCKVGFSLRAVGPITEKRGDTVTVKDPLTIFSYDWVIHPSHAAAYMDCIMSESTQPSIITNLRESFTPIFEPYYEDATKYLIESSKNLNIIAESMEIQMKEKTIGKDILVSEDAKSIYIRDGHDTIVVKPEEYLTKEITSYMSNLDLYGESKVIVDMNGNKVPLNEIKISWDTYEKIVDRAEKDRDKEVEPYEWYKELYSDEIKKADDKMVKRAKRAYSNTEYEHKRKIKKLEQKKLANKKNKDARELLGNIENEIGKRPKRKVQFPSDEVLNNTIEVEQMKQNVRKKQEEVKKMQQELENNKKPANSEPKQVEVAKKGSSALENIRKFGSKHKKGLKIAGAIAGATALAGGAYYLHKKHKEKKAKEQENQNKSESFNVFVFDEEAYITESTMDMLLEACDYELSESEILNNIENELNEDGQIFNESLTPAFYNAVKSGDLTSVRIMMKDSLLSDPTFKQFEEMEKAASGLKGLFVPHDGENFQPQNSWNDNYMNREMVKVVGNFSHERVNELKKIVRHQRPIDKVMSKVTASQPAQPTNQSTQVNVAKKGSSAMDKIRQFGSTHKKGLKVAGAIAGTAALAGGAYYLHKKYKEKKAKEREEANKLESFNVFVFDEEAYITESTMDFLLESCDYELNENEILVNIENELIQEGFFDGFKAKRQAKEAERQAAAKRKSELCMKHRTDLSKERNRLVSIARHLINTEFSDLKKGALFDTSYDYPEDGELTVVSFDQFELIPNFRANYGKYSHKVYDRVANLKSKLNSQVSSDMFKVKIDDDGDWDDPYHIYVSLNISNINEDTELLDEDGRREGESVEEYARRISGFTPQDQLKAEAKREKQMSKAADSAAGKGSTATAAVLGAGSAFAGKENKKRRMIAGAILGTAAAAGTAYAINKALKKRKAKKAEDRDKESVSECMIDLILDEDYVYITEEDMDFLLEACDYELSESEILDNIENELNEEFKFKRGENSNKGSYKGNIDGKGMLTSRNEFVKSNNGKIVVKSEKTQDFNDITSRKVTPENLGKYMRSNAKNALASDLSDYGEKSFMKDKDAERDAAKLAKHMKLTDKDKEKVIKRNHYWDDNAEDVDAINKKSFDNADKIYNDHKNSKSTKTVDSQTNNTEQPKQVEVAKKGSNALENIKKFGSTHKKGLKIAGAIAGTAALAGGAYYLHKKHKEKKAKEREEANKSESFNVFVFDESAYITESTMDMLLEACDYELSESEILDNISESLLSEIKVDAETLDRLNQRTKERYEKTNKDINNTVSKLAGNKEEQLVFGQDSEIDKLQQKKADNHKRFVRQINRHNKYDEKNYQEKLKNNSEEFKKEISKIETPEPENKKVEVASKNSSAMDKIKQFGKDHKKGLKIAGAIAGTTALVGGAYYLHKKHKEKKAREEAENQNKSESFNVFVFDEEAYITESTMDMLLEACDYELTESEILDNIENELIQEGFFADLKAKKEAKAAKWAQERKMEQDEAKRLYNQFKSRIPNELKSHNMGMPEWSDENDSDIFNFEFSEEVQENHKEFDKLSEILYQFSKKIEKGTKFEVDTHGDDTVVSIRITGVPKINNESSELIQEGFFDKLKVNKGPSREEKAKAKAQLEEDKKVLTAEAKRLFSLVKTRLTPMLKKAKDDAGDNEFNYYNGLDQSSAKEAEVCICRFDYLPFKDDFGYDNEGYAAFEKMMDKAKTECERLAQFLNNKTEYNISVELDTNCYYIMIKK